MKNGPYILITAPTGYPGKRYRNKYAYEHQVVWWQNTGIEIPKDHAIHHKNGIRDDNRIENLEMLHVRDHNHYHATLKPRTQIRLVCSYCKKEFIREKRQVTAKINSGQTRFFCNKSHSGSGGRRPADG